MIKRLILSSGFALSIVMPITQAAQAQVVVYGKSEAGACFIGAKTDQIGRIESINRCATALAEENLTQKARAGTYVNMGILQMRRGDFAQSLESYDAALELKPELAQAHNNRGACLILMDRPKEAIDVLSKSIDLGKDSLPDALFNRAVAYEKLGLVKEAYNDFRQALRLRPNWELPTRALEHYQVGSKSQ